MSTTMPGAHALRQCEVSDKRLSKSPKDETVCCDFMHCPALRRDSMYLYFCRKSKSLSSEFYQELSYAQRLGVFSALYRKGDLQSEKPR